MNGDAGKTCAKSKQETWLSWFHHSVVWGTDFRCRDARPWHWRVRDSSSSRKKEGTTGRAAAKIGEDWSHDWPRPPMKPHFCAEVWNWALILGFFFFPDILQFFVCPYIIVPILACCPFPIWTDSPQYDNRYSYSSHRWLIWLSRHRIFFRVPVSIRCVVYWLSNHRFIDIKRCRSRTADTTITQSTFFYP